jgi:hypothetical protein
VTSATAPVTEDAEHPAKGVVALPEANAKGRESLLVTA